VGYTPPIEPKAEVVTTEENEEPAEEIIEE